MFILASNHRWIISFFSGQVHPSALKIERNIVTLIVSQIICKLKHNHNSWKGIIYIHIDNLFTSFNMNINQWLFVSFYFKVLIVSFVFYGVFMTLIFSSNIKPRTWNIIILKRKSRKLVQKTKTKKLARTQAYKKCKT